MGNPFTGPDAVDRYRAIVTLPYLTVINALAWEQAGGSVNMLQRIICRDARLVAELKGKDLACWCPLSEACHADVLLEIFNP